MANALYDLGRQGFLDGNISWTSNTIKVVGVDTGAYTPNLGTNQFLSDIPSGARIFTSPALSGKTSTSGVADANDVTITGVTGTTVEAIVIYQDTGTVGTSRLIAYIDTASGLVLTPNGSDVTITWPSDANRIFRL